MKHRHLRHGALVGVGIAAALILGEGLVWLTSPTEYLYPRYQFSSEYGLIPFANVTMVHGIPRKYQYRYTVGAMHARGDTPAPAETGAPVVVVLGDSYGFGMGVADGEEFPAVMQRALGRDAIVANLASPGWGLTQEIRRFVETGEAYDPRVVVLQFCANDPDDNLTNRVTMLRDGEFQFVESANSLNWIKKYLSRSFIQRTQLYNFFRTRASTLLLERLVRREESRLETARPSSAGGSGPLVRERIYIELLDAFAARLKADGRTLIVISIDHQLEQFPAVQEAVRELDAAGALRYVEVLEWLDGLPPYQSPEGHVWGRPAHAVVGEHLAGVVAQSLASGGAAPPAANR